MLFDRQRVLLELLDALNEPVGSTDFQKLLFLYTREGEPTPSYDFVPYRFGCFSFTSYADKRRLMEQGLIDEDEQSWKLTDKGRRWRELEKNRRYRWRGLPSNTKTCAAMRSSRTFTSATRISRHAAKSWKKFCQKKKIALALKLRGRQSKLQDLSRSVMKVKRWKLT